MDSLSQLVLGSAIGVAVMGRRTAVWKAALWGGICGTLPDLDVFIDYGDPVANMTLHRTETHALFYLTLAAPVIGGLIAKVQREMAHVKQWMLMTWLALITHALLDACTVYGTQLLLPFSDHPFGTDSVFIIDPLYTLPLCIGLAVALLLRRRPAGLKWNMAGLGLSTAYLLWGLLVQAHITQTVRSEPGMQDVQPQHILVTPSPMNTVLWRIVVVDADGRGYREGLHSLLDKEPFIRFDHFANDPALFAQLKSHWPVARMAWFTQGFFSMRETGGKVYLSDLRMGQEPNYSFRFLVAERRPDGSLLPLTASSAGSRGDIKTALQWTWQRMWGAQIAPLR